MRWRRIAVFVGSGVVLAILVGIIILRLKWPFSRQELTESVQEIVPGDVQMERFRSTFFPHPGCVAENVTVKRSAGTPLVSVQRIAIEARYIDIVVRPGYIARITLQGLHIVVPARGSDSGMFAKASGHDSSSDNQNTRVAEIITQGAVLEVGRRGGQTPLKFEIHEVKLGSVRRGSAFSYEVALTNALPPGEITSSGHLGPWNGRDLGQTPVSGSYQFRNAELGALAGVDGTLSSQSNFEGELDRIDLHGGVDVASFVVKGSKQKVDLHAQYAAAVDALNGDVFLQRVQASFLHTTVAGEGQVAKQKGEKGKTASFQLAVHQGRIEDVLGLFAMSGRSPFAGATNFQANVEIPPDPGSFLRKVNLRGDFVVDGGRFGNPETQANVNDLSRRASGKKTEENGDAEPALSQLKGHVVLHGGIANFSNVDFVIPAATAQGGGQYNLLNEKIDFRGTLRTQAELSQTTKGIKSVLLKPLDRFFKKKNAGAEVPVAITGTYSEPHFGIDLSPARKATPAQ